MARSQLDTEIRSRIDSFLADIATLVRQSAVEAVRGALGEDSGNGQAPRRGPGRPAGSGAGARVQRKAGRRGGTRAKRSTEEVDQMADRLAEYVASNPGQGAEEIAKGMGITTKELKLPVVKLLGSRRLKTTGQKRGTKYFAGGRGGARKGRRKGGRKAVQAAA
jgi:hypothetical protein